MILILLLAFGLRAYGISFGTPFEGYYWWDERSALTKALTIASDPGLSSLRLGPYPVVLAAIFYPLSVVQNHTWNPRAVSLISLNDQLLIARTLSVLAGTMLVGVVYGLGRRLAGRWAGLSAALLTAVSPTLVAESRYATTGMSGLLLLYLALLPLTNRRLLLWKRMALSLPVALLAMLTKSNGIVAFAFPPLWLAIETFTSPVPRRSRMLHLVGIAALVGGMLAGLLLVMWLLNPAGVLEYLGHALRYARTDRPGASPLIAWRWMARHEWPLLLGGAVGTIHVLLRREGFAKALPLVIFAASYAVFVSLFGTLFVRWLMIILPALAVLAGSAAAATIAARLPSARRLAVGLLAVAAMFGAVSAWHLGNNLLHDARIAAWAWAQEQLPAGARIAMEGHALPNGDPVFTRYRVQLVKRAIDQPPSYYADNGFHYILIADDMYDRWQAHPDAHPEEMRQYRALIEEYPEIATFHGTLLHAPPAIDIRVLRVTDVPLRPVDQLTLGAGWYDAERQATTGTEYRWMTEKGQLFYNWSGAGNTDRVLSFDAYVFRDKGEISLFVNGALAAHLSLDPATSLHATVPVRLSAGENTFDLVSERGCGRPRVSDPRSRDSRCISIKVGNLMLEAAP